MGTDPTVARHQRMAAMCLQEPVAWVLGTSLLGRRFKTHSGLSLVTLASQVGGGSGQWPMKEFKLISPKEPAFRQLTMLFDE